MCDNNPNRSMKKNVLSRPPPLTLGENHIVRLPVLHSTSTPQPSSRPPALIKRPVPVSPHAEKILDTISLVPASVQHKQEDKNIKEHSLNQIKELEEKTLDDLNNENEKIMKQAEEDVTKANSEEGLYGNKYVNFNEQQQQHNPPQETTLPPASTSQQMPSRPYLEEEDLDETVLVTDFTQCEQKEKQAMEKDETDEISADKLNSNIFRLFRELEQNFFISSSSHKNKEDEVINLNKVINKLVAEKEGHLTQLKKLKEENASLRRQNEEIVKHAQEDVHQARAAENLWKNHYDEMNDQLTNIKTESEGKSEMIESLTSRVEDNEKQNSEIEETLSKKRDEISTISNELKKVKSDHKAAIEKKDKKIKDVKGKMKALQIEMDELPKKLASQFLEKCQKRRRKRDVSTSSSSSESSSVAVDMDNENGAGNEADQLNTPNVTQTVAVGNKKNARRKSRGKKQRRD